MDTTTIETFLKTTAVDLLIKILAATAFWIIGRWLISWVTRLVRTSMDRNRMDQTLNKYLSAIITASLNLLLVLGILGYFGVQTTSFAALIAGAVLGLTGVV
jgi:small conductance mechanosensitive channel